MDLLSFSDPESDIDMAAIKSLVFDICELLSLFGAVNELIDDNDISLSGLANKLLSLLWIELNEFNELNELIGDKLDNPDKALTSLLLEPSLLKEEVNIDDDRDGLRLINLTLPLIPLPLPPFPTIEIRLGPARP
jgi:hypothetical protein